MQGRGCSVQQVGPQTSLPVPTLPQLMTDTVIIHTPLETECLAASSPLTSETGAMGWMTAQVRKFCGMAAPSTGLLGGQLQMLVGSLCSAATSRYAMFFFFF